MTATFNTTRLVNSRTVVRGTDKFGAVGETTIDSSQWDEIVAHDEFHQATADFDAAVTEFFAPLNAAADAVQRKLTMPKDPLSYVVLHEGIEGVQAQDAEVVELSRDSMILRLIENNAFHRLVWVGDELEILEDDGSDEPLTEDTVSKVQDALNLLREELGAEGINVEIHEIPNASPEL